MTVQASKGTSGESQMNEERRSVQKEGSEGNGPSETI